MSAAHVYLYISSHLQMHWSRTTDKDRRGLESGRIGSASGLRLVLLMLVM